MPRGTTFTQTDDSLSASLWQAVGKGGFARTRVSLAFQPIVDLATSQIVKTEALLRAKNGGQAAVPPMIAIAEAKKQGILADLTYLIFFEACRQTLIWQKMIGEPLGISVNVSILTFSEPRFAETVKRLIAEIGISPESVQIEITETDEPPKAFEQARKNAAELRTAGIKIVIDDFCTGFSAYYLRIDKCLTGIKIDRQFVGALPKADGQATIERYLAIADECNLRVTGEGIETSEQMTILQSLGCPLGQGYYFSRPGSAEEIGQKIRQGLISQN